mgnify:CR=1 FL=1
MSAPERAVSRGPIRVAVVEDQPLFRQMIAALLTSAGRFDLVGAWPDAASAREGLAGRRLDVALLDYRLPDGDGIALGRWLRSEQPGLGIVLLSATDNMNALLDLAASELRGWSYLSKTSSLSSRGLLAALEATAEGRTVLDPALSERRSPRRGTGLDALSPRQYEVLELVAEGLTNTAIAHRLGIADRSVDNHVSTIYQALEIGADGERNPRVEAVRRFLTETA